MASLIVACQHSPRLDVTPSAGDLSFTDFASRWDEAIPLGNATVGALVWQHGDTLRLSLDRVDLWDLRPSDSLAGPDFTFQWVKDHIRRQDYRPVQKKLDDPYDREPGPSKIPGAALELALDSLGRPSAVELYLNNALCEARWDNGARLLTFVHATEPVGWLVFEGLPEDVTPEIVMPRYSLEGTAGEESPVTGQDLRRLGYKQGEVTSHADGDVHSLVYHQPGYDDFSYDVAVSWERRGDALYAAWSLTSSMTPDQALAKTQEALKRGVESDYRSHMDYWDGFWAASSINVPDSVIQRQYLNEMYKLGSAAREDSYPISLQAVWTADNGHLPPWKGDYHHDLNTQLSYWPVYTANHLQEGLGYLNTLWDQRDVYRRYTQQYFGTDGMNIPGVCTLTGEPMGGWIQYSMSQTVAAWLAQHFYLHWRYSADPDFLAERGYPFLKDVATYMEQQSEVKDGVRRLEYSSSPEINDNSLEAWFPEMTNYDLSLMQWLFGAAFEMASALDLPDEAAHWAAVRDELPVLDLDEKGGLTFAPGHPYDVSHRHFSHAMAIHPLGLVDWSQGEESQQIIRATIESLKEHGPDYWVGYSYAWLANLQARAHDGEGAAETLRTFAECFCLPNTFHANGDQTRSGKSRFTYRPFTLEGNFAFASGVQEMLLQSHAGRVEVFPAIPAEWRTAVSFDNLRAMGGFLVSATMEEGRVTRLSILSERGGELRLLSPLTGEEEVYPTTPGQRLTLI
ncbi:MAG: hypothetical protein LIO90_09255 [Bacteroidales bacterium]|nr:hypothetical protein [Bacteroidales bacterium]